MNRRDIQARASQVEALVSAPQYMCRGCARVSSDAKNLCKPKALNHVAHSQEPQDPSVFLALSESAQVAEQLAYPARLSEKSDAKTDMPVAVHQSAPLPNLGKKEMKKAKKQLKLQKKQLKKVSKLVKAQYKLQRRKQKLLEQMAHLPEEQKLWLLPPESRTSLH